MLENSSGGAGFECAWRMLIGHQCMETNEHKLRVWGRAEA